MLDGNDFMRDAGRALTKRLFRRPGTVADTAPPPAPIEAPPPLTPDQRRERIVSLWGEAMAAHAGWLHQHPLPLLVYRLMRDSKRYTVALGRDAYLRLTLALLDRARDEDCICLGFTFRSEKRDHGSFALPKSDAKVTRALSPERKHRMLLWSDPAVASGCELWLDGLRLPLPRAICARINDAEQAQWLDDRSFVIRIAPTQAAADAGGDAAGIKCLLIVDADARTWKLLDPKAPPIDPGAAATEALPGSPPADRATIASLWPDRALARWIFTHRVRLHELPHQLLMQEWLTDPKRYTVVLGGNGYLAVIGAMRDV